MSLSAAAGVPTAVELDAVLKNDMMSFSLSKQHAEEKGLWWTGSKLLAGQKGEPMKSNV